MRSHRIHTIARITPGALLVLGFVACTSDSVEDEDGLDDSFAADGKADGGLSDTEVRGVLRVVNELDAAALVDDVRLSTRPARNVIAHRNGPDGALGTSDDNLFDTLKELDDIPYIGPIALDRIVDYARDNGYIAGPPGSPAPGTIAFDQPLRIDILTAREPVILEFSPNNGDEVYFRVEAVSTEQLPYRPQIAVNVVPAGDPVDWARGQLGYLQDGVQGAEKLSFTSPRRYALATTFVDLLTPAPLPARVQVTLKRNLPYNANALSARDYLERDEFAPTGAPNSVRFTFTRSTCDGPRLAIAAVQSDIVATGAYRDLATYAIADIAADGTFAVEQRRDRTNTTVRASGRIVGDEVILENFRYGVTSTTGAYLWSIYSPSEVSARLAQDTELLGEGCYAW